MQRCDGFSRALNSRNDRLVFGKKKMQQIDLAAYLQQNHIQAKLILTQIF
ncbi:MULTISPECIES: hypothetical protein [unclassified Microcoleus]|nr:MULTISPECIES: hypothetical protein [unclassified Microcoleus]MCC3505574.1 hypothetical protein [Microcoleus sp. PH2017_19_SFW_U_A]MCC3473429.1 hypothetical protein [Microcoleus sp. PH2017_13_LAR_U_A]MCC3485758.1 hypothetical protein [Microcoleus sp. PH2017_14_LAR_D_A]MCC3498120.1 hypothetical protein [Microcoleus sp. PH2017_15_JOR_U_A]MCC3524016.1 hypothetical protein [Microcoleus sp. PH2017_20_SFW_D_A]